MLNFESSNTAIYLVSPRVFRWPIILHATKFPRIPRFHYVERVQKHWNNKWRRNRRDKPMYVLMIYRWLVYINWRLLLFRRLVHQPITSCVLYRENTIGPVWTLKKRIVRWSRRFYHRDANPVSWIESVTSSANHNVRFRKYRHQYNTKIDETHYEKNAVHSVRLRHHKRLEKE